MSFRFPPSAMLFICAFFALFSHNSLYAEKYKEIYIEPTPEWVQNRDIILNDVTPVDEINDGVFYQLLDTQIRVSDTQKIEKYSHYIETITNQAGVDYTSQLNLDFDPSYQKLVLNTLFIIRNGQRINKLKTAKITLLNRETELENQIYNGSITLNVLIDDLQIGDTISYSYTRYGENPVYQGIFAYTRLLNWSVPVQNQYVRVLWGKKKPLEVSTRNIEPNLIQRNIGKFTEYQVHMENVATLRMASETPSWYEPYGWISFSESRHWGDVVEWAETLYQPAPLHPSIVNIAENIKQQHKTLPEQIAAALQFTQKHIRYVGLEMGVNSHMPTPAHETIILKYGDCKDKALLFIALLKALGVDAYPALVNTEESKLLKDRLPAINLFDHVIVGLKFDNKQFWLDPTLSHQEGALENLFQPDYGYALIVKSGEEKLTPMNHSEHNSHTLVRDSYVIPVDVNDVVTFNVESRYLGNKAQAKYSQIERDGKKKLTEDYEVFYQRTYPKLSKTQAVDITSDTSSGVLTLTESYAIEQFWQKDEADYERSFYPSDIRNAVFKPKQVTRNDPLWFEFPNNITNEIVLKFVETGWGFENSEFIEDNAFFYFKRRVNFADNTLTLTYDYKSKVDHIPSTQITEYMTARDILRDKAYYGITKYSEETKLKNAEIAADDSTYSQSMWILIVATIYLLGFIFILVSWRLESRKRPKFSDNHFTPISVTKFLTLSFATYGLYSSYWTYRNWKEIQQKQQSHIMPIARGIFSVFWFYPLFIALKNDSEEHFKRNQVMLPIVAAICATLLVLITLLSSAMDTLLASLLMYLSPLFYIPFLNYINVLNKNESLSYRYNSKWNLRSIIAVIIFMPFFGYVVAQQTPLIPSSNIISEADIMEYDMKYLYRQNILPADETIQLFYSDAIFTIRDDGNGFTKNRVFSYWQDDATGFQREIAKLQDIKHIAPKYADSESDTTIVTITRNDDSQFELFISAFDREDKIFVKELKSVWRLAKAD